MMPHPENNTKEVPYPADLPPLKEVIQAHGLRSKKSFGQHFLLDLNITRKIARHAGISQGDYVIEIGPGPGGLTRALLETGAHVIAIEKDARCVAALAPLIDHFPGQLTIHIADALKIDEVGILSDVSAPAPPTGPVRIIANLPYNVSTALLMKWLIPKWITAKWLAPGTPFWDSLTLMFQKEVADRILAPPNSKAYGRLSVMAQTAAIPRSGFDLPARAFTPMPKVDSAIVLFDRPRDPSIPLGALEKVTRAAFSQRRKMLRTSLKTIFDINTAQAIRQAGLKATARAEEIDAAGYIRLARYLHDWQGDSLQPPPHP